MRENASAQGRQEVYTAISHTASACSQSGKSARFPLLRPLCPPRILLTPQALDQQRSTKATFHIQSGKSAHLSQNQHHQGCMGALGHELAVPITITRNADKAISTLPEQLFLSPWFPGLWLQIGLVLQSLPQALVS